ncbi:uncharacterized protein LOC135119722 [Zophobas morio]|uniref:uncharacterized protein LOC135119722 n=1 Tax=Zophobas morio TaxID=2755281 RepID=UPI00308315C0
MPVETVAELRSRRGIAKSKITRIENFVKNFKNTDNVYHLEVRLETLENVIKEYESYQTQIELQDNADNDREIIETQYYNIIVDIREKLNKYSPSSASSQNNSNPNNNHHLETSIKLPTLNLPTFSGSYSEWLSFNDIFCSLIDQNNSLNNCQKFHYLKSSLKGEALATIDALTISVDNYKSAYDLLRKRYNNVRLITQEHILAIINSPVILKTNSVALRKLCVDVTTNIEALRIQNLPVESWDALIVPLIVEKLDYTSRKEWQATLNSEIPKLTDLISFLEKRCELLESMQQISVNKTHSIDVNKHNNNSNKNCQRESTTKQRILVQTINKNILRCNYCKSELHLIFQCTEFVNLSVEQRLSHINKVKSCTNCLKSNHIVSNCKSSNTCKKCHLRHHTLLHIPEQSTSNLSLSVSHMNNTTVLLATAVVKIADAFGNYQDCRIIFDSCSQSNLISTSLCQKLGLKLQSIEFPISGVGEIETPVKNSTRVTIKSRFNPTLYNLNCLVLPNITSKYPCQFFSKSQFNIPININLADPNFNEPCTVDLLLGAEYFWQVICNGQINIFNNQVFLRESVFGWVLTGKISGPSQNNIVACISNANPQDMLNKEIHKFWELEETAVNTSNSFSVEELTCERHFSETVKRDINGRFMVRLPFKKDIATLGFSDVTALKRFMALETRLNKNNSLKADYTNFLDEYLALGHMKLVTGESDFHTKQLYFFPHHAVIKSSSTTTRVRVVFDGSCKTSTGVSLNNILMVGPTIQQDLFSIITRFRTYQFAFSNDVVKMYRQIWVDPSDTPYQRIFWRKSSDKPVEVYELQTVTYGTACAPYLAIKCLQKLAIDEQLDFPLASTIILRDFYVDDLLTGTNSVKEAIELRNQLIGALNRGGFQLQKWASNCPDILPNCSQNNDVVKLDHNDEVKTLGSTWNCKTDCLKYVVETKPVENTTKRSILSKIARIYDILGLLSPVLVLGKILIQKLWLIKLDWDDPLPEEIRQTWLKLEQELPILNTLQIPRKVVSNQYNNVEIHGFCDASMSAYGACVYIRTLDLNTNSYKTELLCARSRVSPLKTITLPRLELCAAVLLARLIHKLLPTINLNITTQYMWTDSSIVLSWLASSPSTWNVFVANRVAEISTLTSISNWHHVKCADNPADIVSRGELPNKLITSDLWWHGPYWLSKNKSEWPASSFSSNAQNVPILVVTNDNVLPLLIKYHLKRVAGNALLTYEELYTLLTQIEACINSQSLTPLSSDPSDLTALTPGHFLIGGKLTTSVEDDVTMVKENRLSRWQRVQQQAQSFWKRWSGEFLNKLQQRKKWSRTAKTEVKPGLPVLLREDNLHPMCWRMGVVMETHPGKDAIVRTATIRTSSGPVVRAINRICPFPNDDDTQV